MEFIVVKNVRTLLLHLTKIASYTELTTVMLDRTYTALNSCRLFIIIHQ